MNWTGGRLQRHSTKANAATQRRQKQHFAKVVLNLRGCSKYKSPVKWSILDRMVEDGERSQRKTSPTHTPAVSNNEQSNYLMRRHLGLDNPHVRDLHENGQSTTPAADRVNTNITTSQQQTKHGQVPDDDLYNATPPPPKLKRQREESVPLSEPEGFVDRQEEETVLEKKRRILQKGDWVGTSIQKPLVVTFASPRDEENIGRRRKIPHGQPRARYEKRQAHITSPFPPRARCPDNIAPSAWARYQQELQAGKSDVRISIGGRVVPPGLSSSSVPRTHPRQKSQDTQSDVMLLDYNSVSCYEDPQQRPGPFHHYNTSSYHSRHQREASQLSQVYLPREAPSEIDQTNQYPQMAEDWAGFSNDHLSDAERNTFRDPYEQKLRDGADSDFESREVLPPLVVQSDRPIQMIFSSSSASIHHPKPQSSRTSMLIRSDSSDSPEGAQSTMAQVGKRQPAVPSSQVEENEVWESWIAPLYQEPSSQDDNGFGNRGFHEAVNISPGISMVVPPQRAFESYASSQHEDSAKYLDSNHGSFIEELSSEGLPPPQPSLKLSEEFKSSEVPQDATSEVDTEPQPITNDQNKVPEGNQKPLVPESEAEDSDVVWRKFVFGSSSDEEKELSLMPSTHGWEGHQTEIESSIVAQPPTSSDQGDQRFARQGSTFKESWQRPRQTSLMKSQFTANGYPRLPSSNSSSKYPHLMRASTSLPVMQARHRSINMAPRAISTAAPQEGLCLPNRDLSLAESP